MSRPLRVAVIGAGLAGLTAAHAIRRLAAERGRPLRLTVLEAGDRAGGQLHTTHEHGFTIDWAANAFRTGAGPTADLVERLGLEGEQVVARPAAARRYVFHGGRLHALPSGPASLLRFAPLSVGGRWRVLAEPFVARRVDREESVHDYAARHIGPEAAGLLLGTLVRGVYGGDARALSVDAAFPVMRAMERDHRSLVVAGVAGARARARERKRTWSFRCGMGALPARLANELGAAVRLGVSVTGLRPAADGTGYRIERADGGSEEHDAVVLAVAPRVAAPWLRPLDAELADEAAAITAADVAVVALAFRTDAFSTPPDGYGFLVAPGEPLDALGALYESNVFPGRAPEGSVLIRVILGGVGRADVVARSEAELTAAAVGAVEAALGRSEGPERVWVRRVPGAIPQYLLGHLTRVERIEARLRRLPGLHVAGNAYRGVAVGAIVADAEVVAERVVARPGDAALSQPATVLRARTAGAAASRSAVPA